MILRLESVDGDTLSVPLRQHIARAEARVADAWAKLAVAEQEGKPRRRLCELEAAYHQEMEMLTQPASPREANPR